MEEEVIPCLFSVSFIYSLPVSTHHPCLRSLLALCLFFSSFSFVHVVFVQGEAADGDDDEGELLVKFDYKKKGPRFSFELRVMEVKGRWKTMCDYMEADGGMSGPFSGKFATRQEAVVAVVEELLSRVKAKDVVKKVLEANLKPEDWAAINHLDFTPGAEQKKRAAPVESEKSKKLKEAKKKHKIQDAAFRLLLGRKSQLSGGEIMHQWWKQFELISQAEYYERLEEGKMRLGNLSDEILETTGDDLFLLGRRAGDRASAGAWYSCQETDDFGLILMKLKAEDNTLVTISNRLGTRCNYSIGHLSKIIGITELRQKNSLIKRLDGVTPTAFIANLAKLKKHFDENPNTMWSNWEFEEPDLQIQVTCGEVITTFMMPVHSTIADPKPLVEEEFKLKPDLQVGGMTLDDTWQLTNMLVNQVLNLPGGGLEEKYWQPEPEPKHLLCFCGSTKHYVDGERFFGKPKCGNCKCCVPFPPVFDCGFCVRPQFQQMKFGLLLHTTTLRYSEPYSLLHFCVCENDLDLYESDADADADAGAEQHPFYCESLDCYERYPCFVHVFSVLALEEIEEEVDNNPSTHSHSHVSLSSLSLSCACAYFVFLLSGEPRE
jgi:hypothetical protein